MHRPSIGSAPYDWLYELPDSELETLEQGLHELITQRPSAFSTFKAHSMREAIECILFDRQQARRQSA
ncbi:hypothetical protein HZU75_12485 [Chitinibacter fontanus]|uniref:Uncharacterized protein n=1 Tax=Chitinibacter fontanus TaxID=1737446 RepID=A0A7D5VAQ8_9NEIS|nr:hypothetical protein [Chitinibacter fontanus]QLI82275.1 hypothetical protein HZU75_12485 [Chitinibacter fontanus]